MYDGNHLAQRLRAASLGREAATFLTDQASGQNVSYDSFWANAERMAAALASLGVMPGDRVAIQAPKTVEMGRVASITGQARSTLTRENGQPTDSNLAQPSSVILLRARTPICASVF